MAGADYIWKHLGTVWDHLPEKERSRFSELWKGQEQVFADILQTVFELDRTTSVNQSPVYLSSRWNKYDFNANNEIVESAVLNSFQDLSLGVDLSEFFLIKISVDGGEPKVIDCRGPIPEKTTIFQIIFKINQAFGFALASSILEDTIIQLKTKTKGPAAKIEVFPTNTASDGTELILGLTSIELPFKVPKYPFKFRLADKRVKKIPSLQDSIRNEVLRYYIISGPDFAIDGTKGTISFIERPPEKLWAKVSYIDEEVPYHNFGYLIDYRDSTISPEDYLQNLQGLWFAFWQGPRPDFIRRALYLLFSLPVAVDTGVVTRFVGEARGIVEILHSDGQVRAYALPDQLLWEVQVGDFVEKFQPLVNGIDIFDKTNFPGFVRTELGRDSLNIFALDDAIRGTGEDTDETKALKLLEEHTFLPQINVNAFVRPNINVGSILTFLRNIKPLHKAFYFQIIVAVFNESITFKERFGLAWDFEVTPNLEINQANTSTPATREAYEGTDNPPLDLDSEDLYFFERGSLAFEDITGPLPDYDVVFD